MKRFPFLCLSELFFVRYQWLLCLGAWLLLFVRAFFAVVVFAVPLLVDHFAYRGYHVYSIEFNAVAMFYMVSASDETKCHRKTYAPDMARKERRIIRATTKSLVILYLPFCTYT